MLLFLGAGASKPFGIPTMRDFLKLFDQEVGSSPLYNAIKAISEKDCDLEVLMTVVEDLTKSPGEFFRAISPQTAFFLLQKERNEANRYLADESREEAKALLTKIKAIIRRECSKAVSDDSKILKVYDDFFNLLAEMEKEMKPEFHFNLTTYGRRPIMVLPTKLRIFTTNYDTCVEVYFNRKEIDFSRGIVNRYGEDVFDVDEYGSLQSQNKAAKIYKLHGSVDLFEAKGKIRLFTAAGGEKTFLGESYGEESLHWPIEFGGYRHVIESPYLDLFRLLRDTAQEENWWIFIGFSFRDRTICSLLNDVLRIKSRSERPNALLLTCHPEPVVERLKEWGYQAIVDTIHPVEAEFGSGGFSSKFSKALLDKEYIRRIGGGVVEK
jgi:hypothetical protein